jgi:cbb3-type cytochrome oxidase maturation protein
VFAILVALRWAIQSGQFDDIEREGERILEDD